MKYLVNTRTKEHRVHTDEYFEDVDVWRIVEADEEGWIPWNGGECPLPDGHKYNFTSKKCPSKNIYNVYSQPENNVWEPNWGSCVTAYRPIIAEKEEPRRHGRTIVHIPESQQSVFDRLKSAIAASESIPAIIAEIDALLPKGYFVSKTLTDIQESIGTPLDTAEDMSDWRNWRKGDLVECIVGDGWGVFKTGGVYKITKQAGRRDIGVEIERHPVNAHISDFRFHSRSAKVTQ